MATQKLGAGHAQAWLRAGLKELGQVFGADGTIKPVEEPGLVGNPTPVEVTQQRQEPSLFEQYVRQAGQTAGRSADRSADRSRGMTPDV